MDFAPAHRMKLCNCLCIRKMLVELGGDYDLLASSYTAISVYSSIHPPILAIQFSIKSSFCFFFRPSGTHPFSTYQPILKFDNLFWVHLSDCRAQRTGTNEGFKSYILIGLYCYVFGAVKHVTLFLVNFDPLSALSHFVTHPGTPKSTPHISDPLRDF